MNANITVIQEQKYITFIGTVAMGNFLPFSFSQAQGNLTPGQTVFTLPSVPLAVWVYVTGSAQNQANNDFTLVNNVLTLSSPVLAGDSVYGVIQVQ